MSRYRPSTWETSKVLVKWNFKFSYEVRRQIAPPMFYENFR